MSRAVIWSMWGLLVALSVTEAVQTAAADDKQPSADASASDYSSSEEAYRVGIAFLSSRSYAKARAPLEAALKLAPDDEARIRVYRALVAPYGEVDDWQLKRAALDFIISRTKQPAERSLARSELASFIRQRGKTTDAIKHYEERLQTNPDDDAALYTLIELQARVRNDPERAAAMLEQYAKLKTKGGAELAVAESAQLAEEYVKGKKYREGAELFEKTAERDADLAAWYRKEAAQAWLKLGDKGKALAAAKASEQAKPEKRTEMLVYFWHRGLADVFLDAGDPKAAIPHYETAIASTKIDGYLKDSGKRLEQAKADAGATK